MVLYVFLADDLCKLRFIRDKVRGLMYTVVEVE